MMRFDILSIFPTAFESYCQASILKRAQAGGHINIQTHDIRAFTTDKHGKVDDTPYGGGAGMVMAVEPIDRALQALGAVPGTTGSHIILLSAKGRPFDQTMAQRFATFDRLILVCGRYEGVDERVVEHLVDEELSVGPFVLTGGELPALLVIDAVTRLLPGVLGNETSAQDESFSRGMTLEYPQYTKPEHYRGWPVPPVLLSGHHAEIERWRREQSLSQTRKQYGIEIQKNVLSD